MKFKSLNLRFSVLQFLSLKRYLCSRENFEQIFEGHGHYGRVAAPSDVRGAPDAFHGVRYNDHGGDT